MAEMSQPADFFQFFNFPRQFALDEGELSMRYRALQRRVHPDRHADKTEMERTLALDMASYLNQAYATLKTPLKRAVYLLSLNELDVFSETDTVMPPDFLEKQMEWREALMEADGAERQAVVADICRARDETAADAARVLAAGDWRGAYDVVRRWRYLEKIAEEAAR